MTDLGEIPDVIFDLIRTKPFAELTVEERALVTRHLAVSEYEGFHVAYCASVVFAHDKWRKHTLRSEIHSAYDLHHNRSGTRALKVAWSAAAVLFVALLGFALRQVLFTSGSEPQMLSVRDTVFVKQPGEVRIVRDTVVVEIVAAPSMFSPHSAAAKADRLTRFFDSGDVHVMPVSEVGSDANSLKGNSVFYDSLCLNYQFAEM